MNKVITILVLVLMTFVAVDADGKALSGKTPDYNDIEASRTMRWKVRHADLSSIPATGAKGTRTLLEQSIDEVEMLQLPEYIQPKVEEAEELPSPEVKETVEEKAIEIDEAVRFELQISKLLKNPDSIVNPLAVAETLFNKGSYADSAIFFEIALDRMDKTKEDKDRAWALYQNANSLRVSDKTEAYKIYHKLLAEYPTSYWTNPARVQQQIIAWHEENQPEKLLEKYASESKGQ
jgi:tetratricopeptide (TPR) repeat protein